MPNRGRKMGTKTVSRTKKRYSKVGAWRDIHKKNGIPQGDIVKPKHTRKSWAWEVKK